MDEDDSPIAFFLSAIMIAAPYLVYLNLQSSAMNMTFMLFETKFGSMLVFRQVQPLSVVKRMKMSGTA
jgi:hypothetical protein